MALATRRAAALLLSTVLPVPPPGFIWYPRSNEDWRQVFWIDATQLGPVVLPSSKAVEFSRHEGPTSWNPRAIVSQGSGSYFDAVDRAIASAAAVGMGATRPSTDGGLRARHVEPEDFYAPAMTPGVGDF